MSLDIEYEREDDGRWIADMVSRPGVMAYGKTRDEATKNVLLFLANVILSEIEYGEGSPKGLDFFADSVASGIVIGPKALAMLTKKGLEPDDL